ncbi:MAG: hypothetical protein CMJ82_07255 [Planctomycetaceae bacterium]|nr:hypothetical protein [Planctomycetaceae bacterium]
MSPIPPPAEAPPLLPPVLPAEPELEATSPEDEDEEELPLSSPQPMAKIASKEKMQAIDRMCKILNGKLNI